MRYFELKNSADEVLDITTQEILFHEIDGLGFEETTDFRAVGPVWRLNSAEYNQMAVTGKMLFSEEGELTPYQKYVVFRDFILKAPLTLIYYPHGFGTEPYYKKVRSAKLAKSEINEYGVLDCDIEFMPYTPWYTTSTYENIVPEDREDKYTGWFWDIGNKWRDSDSGGGDPIGTIYYPFSQMSDRVVSGLSITHPSDDQTTFNVVKTSTSVDFAYKSFNIPPGYYRLSLLSDYGPGAPSVRFSIEERNSNGDYVRIHKGDHSSLDSLSVDAVEDVYISASSCTFSFYFPANQTSSFTVKLVLTKIADAARYKFSYETHSSLSFNVDADVKGLAKLKIKGPATNPQWTHYVDGKLVSSGGISSDSELTLGADDILVVDNTEGAYAIDLVKPNGDVVNVYSLRDFDRKCFITLEPGENTINVSSDKGEPLSFEIEGWLLYATV